MEGSSAVVAAVAAVAAVAESQPEHKGSHVRPLLLHVAHLLFCGARARHPCFYEQPAQAQQPTPAASILQRPQRHLVSEGGL